MRSPPIPIRPGAPGFSGGRSRPWQRRSPRISLESYLNCKYKAHLKLTRQQGTKSDYFSCRLSRLLFLGSSRSQAPPGNARFVRLCLCKIGSRQAERARAEPGHEGSSSGAETVLAKGTKPGSPPIISLTEFSSLQHWPGHGCLTARAQAGQPLSPAVSE